MNSFLDGVVKKFNLVNNYTKSPNIWTGHARIGEEGQLSIDEAKKFLAEHFGGCTADAGKPVPKWIEKSLGQWKNFHPYQNVRELDQPLFAKKFGNKIIVAVIWPWQIKEGVASLMAYEGEIIE